LIGFHSAKVGQHMSYHLSGKGGQASAVDVRQALPHAVVSDRPSFTVLRSAAEKVAARGRRVPGVDGLLLTSREIAVSGPAFHLPDEPSELSLRLLVRSLRDDSAKKGISPKTYAHRLRVIRQQTELLARQSARHAEEDKSLAG